MFSSLLELERAVGTTGPGGQLPAAGAPRRRKGGLGGAVCQRVESSPSEPPAVNIPATQRCSDTNRRGEPCKAKAIKDGKCAMHSGLTDPRAMGAAGGKSTETALRNAARVDDALRKKARKALEQALDGNDEKRRFEAAKSLFSYRAESPPQAHSEANLRHPGRGVFSIVDLTRLACERHIFSQGNGVPVELEDAMAKALAEAPDSAD